MTTKYIQFQTRIVSLSQPYLRPIVRGKAKAPVEFGAKLDISVTDGFVRLEKQEYVDICDRVEVERKFSLAKRKCGMGLIMTRLQETTEHAVALSILVLNLRKVLCVFLRWWLFLHFYGVHGHLRKFRHLFSKHYIQ